MIDDVNDIAAYYDEDPRDEAGRLSAHQLERDLTWRYLERHLPPGSSILEIGAATGAYTIPLARRGHTVTAVDLSPALIDRARREVAAQGLEERIRLAVADARDLSAVPMDGFDAVLMMGPLYHLIEEADRALALQQAFDRLRAGGIIFSSFLSRLGVLSDLIRNAPEWIEDHVHVRSFLERGRRPDGIPKGGFRGYFATVAEIAPSHESLGFETLVVAGVEPVIGAHDESFNPLRGEQRGRWLDILEQVSGDPSIVGASRHVLYIGRKPG